MGGGMDRIQPFFAIFSRLSDVSYLWKSAKEGGSKMKNPGIAAVLSFIIPGLGQIYNGMFLRAIFWLVVTPGFWIGTGGTLGWVCHVVSAWTAWNLAHRLRQIEEMWTQ
jgi:TM2 domain-containing membrane protein YozV